MKSAIAFGALLVSFLWTVANAQCDATTCDACQDDCAWCHAVLKKVEGTEEQVMDLGIGACFSENCDGAAASFAGVMGLGGVINEALRTEVVIEEAQECASVYAVAAESETTCGDCLLAGEKQWCYLELSLSDNPSTAGGICLDSESEDCASQSWDASTIDDGLFVGPTFQSECPTCDSHVDCKRCGFHAECSWCGPQATTTNGDQVVGKQNIFGLGLCQESDSCPAGMGTLAHLFADVPSDPIAVVFANVPNPSVICTSMTSGTAWNTVDSCDECLKTDGNHWCDLSGTVVYGADQSFDNSGGVCLASVDEGKCASLEFPTVDEISFSATFDGTVPDACPGGESSASTTVPLLCTSLGGLILGLLLIH